MVVSYREHVVKPDARIYRTLLERYELEAGECLFVDDTRTNVLGARMLGMRAWHFDGTVQGLRDLLL
jgi:HAD superfamily hydrolase (TIGR01509 family)